MCGVVGALSLNGPSFKVTEPYINRMRDVMAHRGPDGAGTWVSADHRIGLGHRRLSIIDLSNSASQPMSNHDGSIWLSFNGEIYNHAEIRRELESEGFHNWRTDHSDTEVIIHAFEHWGIDCLSRFRGMFAFALWDSRREELWLVRDRVGIKPLYYSIHNGRIVFASEIKALLEDPDQKRAVDNQSLFHYLSFLTTPAPNTLFEGIKKLCGGTLLKVSADGSINISRYWDAWDNVTPLENISLADAAGKVSDELRESVHLRQISDVPSGVFLSGGVDSSANAVLFSENSKEPVNTFSIGYGEGYGSSPSELPFARQVAELTGANHHEMNLTLDDLIDFLPRMVELQDEPLADAVCVPVYYVAKMARDHGVKVCQVGEGADELFFGYATWASSLNRQRLNDFPLPRTIKHAGLGLLKATGREFGLAYESLRRSAADTPQFWGGAESFYDQQKKCLLSPRLRQQFKHITSWDALRPIRERFEAKAWDQSTVNWMSYLDLNLRLPELLLMRVDKMTMGASLEGRVPYLDHKFVELALSIPHDVRYQDGELKRVLKKAVRGVIPDTIIDRKKQGFGVPITEWFYERLGTEMAQVVRKFCLESDLLDIEAVNQLIEQESGSQLWFLYNLALWWNRFIK